MIQEDYVSFEIAKLLKEKGFDSKCRYVWIFDKANDPQDTDGICKVCAEHVMEGESFIDNSDIKKVSEYESWPEDYHKAYICPTLQMTLKWLREVHHLYIQVMLDSWACGGHMGYYVVIQNTTSDFEMMLQDALDDVFYDTYEEACEAAIKYCLDNLI